jgi:hypothetical protein
LVSTPSRRSIALSALTAVSRKASLEDGWECTDASLCIRMGRSRHFPDGSGGGMLFASAVSGIAGLEFGYMQLRTRKGPSGQQIGNAHSGRRRGSECQRWRRFAGVQQARKRRQVRHLSRRARHADVRAR